LQLLLKAAIKKVLFISVNGRKKESEMSIATNLRDLQKRVQDLLVSFAIVDRKTQLAEVILMRRWTTVHMLSVHNAARSSKQEDVGDLACMWLNAEESLRAVESYNRRHRDDPL
jgi:hypothetical protein